ncbi:aminotransferase, partial [Dehalococcoides mccartyi]
AFYTFPSVRKTGLSSNEFAEKLLMEEKVAAVPGTAFGESGEGYLRCCYATSLKDIEEAMKRFRHFLKHNCPQM